MVQGFDKGGNISVVKPQLCTRLTALQMQPVRSRAVDTTLFFSNRRRQSGNEGY